MSTLDDTSGVIFNQCSLCAHRAGGVAACKAFPSSIPREIMRTRFDHRHPWIDSDGLPGDVGICGDESILFEPHPDATPWQLNHLEEDLSYWARNYTGPVR